MKQKLLEAFADLTGSIAYAVPKICLGILLITLGFLAAKIAEIIVRALLVRVRFDKLAQKVGAEKTVRRIGVQERLNLVLPKLAYFLVILLVAKTVSDSLGLNAVSAALEGLFAYMPNILAALLLVVLGTTVGRLAGQMVKQAAESSNVGSASALGKLASALIIFIVTIMAIGQLKIDTAMIRIVASFVLGAATLAFGLAFGLGTRDIVRNIVTGYYARKVLTIGNNFEIAGKDGTLIAITATHAILARDGQEITIPNSALLEFPVTQ